MRAAARAHARAWACVRAARRRTRHLLNNCFVCTCGLVRLCTCLASSGFSVVQGPPAALPCRPASQAGTLANAWSPCHCRAADGACNVQPALMQTSGPLCDRRSLIFACMTVTWPLFILQGNKRTVLEHQAADDFPQGSQANCRLSAWHFCNLVFPEL